MTNQGMPQSGAIEAASAVVQPPLGQAVRPKKGPFVPMSEEVTLIAPANVDGVKVGTLTIRRPTVQDRLNADKASGGSSSLEAEIILIANLANDAIDPSVIRSLFWEDYKKCQDAVNRLMGFRI